MAKAKKKKKVVRKARKKASHVASANMDEPLRKYDAARTRSSQNKPLVEEPLILEPDLHMPAIPDGGYEADEYDRIRKNLEGVDLETLERQAEEAETSPSSCDT